MSHGTEYGSVSLPSVLEAPRRESKLKAVALTLRGWNMLFSPMSGVLPFSLQTPFES